MTNVIKSGRVATLILSMLENFNKRQLLKEFIDPCQLAVDLESGRRPVGDILSDASFIRENILGNNMGNTADELILRTFLSRNIIDKLLNRNAERVVLLEVAKNLRRLSVYFETGIIPEHLPTDEDAGL